MNPAKDADPSKSAWPVIGGIAGFFGPSILLALPKVIEGFQFANTRFKNKKRKDQAVFDQTIPAIIYGWSRVVLLSLPILAIASNPHLDISSAAPFIIAEGVFAADTAVTSIYRLARGRRHGFFQNRNQLLN